MVNLKLLFLFVLEILQIVSFDNYQLKFTYEVHCPRAVIFFSYFP
jgi:hypothetical protein